MPPLPPPGSPNEVCRTPSLCCGRGDLGAALSGFLVMLAAALLLAGLFTLIFAD